LRERGFGEWEGRSFEEIQSLIYDSGAQPFDLQPPGGESFRQVWQRLDSVLELILPSNATFAIITHGGTCALLMAKLLRGNIETSRSFRFANTGITELERRPDGMFLMVRYNDTSHLKSLALTGDLDGSRR
jgi:2,3-bisphosphoglycerate-dependent phosphoglycerate mutase